MLNFYLFQKVLATWYREFDQHHTSDLSGQRCHECNGAACVREEMTGTGRREAGNPEAVPNCTWGRGAAAALQSGMLARRRD